jgi:hypothetical protein
MMAPDWGDIFAGCVSDVTGVTDGAFELFICVEVGVFFGFRTIKTRSSAITISVITTPTIMNTLVFLSLEEDSSIYLY